MAVTYSRIVFALGLVSTLPLAGCGDDTNAACVGDECSSTSGTLSGDSASSSSPTSSDDSTSSSTSSGSSATSGSSDSDSNSDASSSTSDTGTATLSIDVFGEVGNIYDFSVNEEQARKMEETGSDPGNGDEYPPVGGGTFADGLRVIAKNGTFREYGKVGLRILGESTRRDWAHIPSLKLDVDKFDKDAPAIDQWERLRLHNGQVGGIFREAVALRIWRALNYATPLTNFAWVRSTVWGPQEQVPYTVVENYKRDWCERTLPDGCVNMWEAAGEIQNLNGNCQLSSCDETRLRLLQTRLMETAPGPGYREALTEYIDWTAYEKFQCLSWLTATGDDYVHNTNNTVLVERPDGKFFLLPYSTDISGGQSWYPQVHLPGISQLAVGCQSDPACWSSLLTTCKGVLDEFEELNISSSIIAPIYTALDQAGMLRERDEQRFQDLSAWYDQRPIDVRNDPIWTAKLCQDSSQCVDAPDGATVCHPEQHVCVEPCHASDSNCPEGLVCDEWTDICLPGERWDELGDRNKPTAVDMPYEGVVFIAQDDEDCVEVRVDGEATGLEVMTAGPGCRPQDQQRTVVTVLDAARKVVATAESPAEGELCASLSQDLAVGTYIVCAASANDKALNSISFVIQPKVANGLRARAGLVH